MSVPQKQPHYVWAGVVVIVAALAFSRGGTQQPQPSPPPAVSLTAATPYTVPSPTPAPETPPDIRDLGDQTRGADAARLTTTQSIPDAPPSASAVGDHQVWVNTNSGVYHFPGQRWYGATKHGMFMSQKDADAAGYRPTMNGQ